MRRLSERTMLRVERLAPWVIGLLIAAPILVVRYPPMGDLAMHEALVAIMRHGGDPQWAPKGMYFVIAPQANQLFHFLAYALSFVVGTALACKLVVAATVFLAPVCTARMLTRVGASRLPSTLVAPIVCGWMFRWGLVANLLGFVLFVAALPLLERLAKRPSPRAAGSAALAACAIFFAHEASALTFAIVAAYVATIRGGRLSAVAARGAPAAMTLLLAILQLRGARGLAGANMQTIGEQSGTSPLERLRQLPFAVFGGADGLRVGVLAGLSFLALLVFVVAKRRRRSRDLPLRLALWRHRYLVLSAVFFVMYLTFPMALAGTTLLAQRFLPTACLFLVVACAPRTSGNLGGLVAMALPLTMLAVDAKSFIDSDRRFRDLDEVLVRLPNNVAVAQLDLTPRPTTQVAPIPGAASRALAQRGGRMLFMLTDMPPNPVYVRADLQWNEPMLRMAQTPYGFMPSHDGRRFSYLLARSASDRYRKLATTALEPEMELVAHKGEWVLFRSKLEVDPVDSPDLPLPTPRPETLALRVNRLLVAPSPGH